VTVLKVEEKFLILVEDIVENTPQHIRMIGLLFSFPVTVVETCHNLSFVGFPFHEAALEVFHKGAFPTAWLSFNKKQVGAIRGRPCTIFLVRPEPLQGAFMLL
jgi:hypothetical protein